MEVINTYTDYLISLVGLEGDLVPVVRHGLLVLVAIAFILIVLSVIVIARFSRMLKMK